MKKICLVASSGGHFSQLKMLEKLQEKYKIFYVTEKTNYHQNNQSIKYYMVQVNRKELLCIIKLFFVFIKSLYILLKEKPDVIISTGALVTIPMCILGKIMEKKVIYIESFANINTPTKTGKLMYKVSDKFYVQWKSMLKCYPNATYMGGLY